MVKFSVWCMSWVWLSYAVVIAPMWAMAQDCNSSRDSLTHCSRPSLNFTISVRTSPIPPAEGKLLGPWSSVTFRELFKYLSRPAFHQTASSTWVSLTLTRYCAFLNCCKNPGGSGRNGDFQSSWLYPPSYFTSLSGAFCLLWLLLSALASSLVTYSHSAIHWDTFRIRVWLLKTCT